MIDYDLGISGIASPVSGVLLSNSEQVIVSVTNYGGVTASEFDITFELNGFYWKTVLSWKKIQCQGHVKR